MPENTPLPPFVQLKRMFQDAGKATGERISSREAHRMAQGFMLTHACKDREDEAYFLGHRDDTGENAVKNALLAFIRQYGTLRSPNTLGHF